MRLAAFVFIPAAALTLASCASTNTENPYYQASTKYKGSSPYTQNTLSVQQAGYETQAAAPISYAPQQASYTRVNQECLTQTGATQTIDCAPVTIAASSQTAAITPAYSAQTYQTSVSALPALPAAPGIVETTQSQGPLGTPGYYAVNGYPEEETSLAQIPAAPAEPVAIPVAAPTPLRALASGNIRHEVIKGDTVYSLARNACVSVAALKQANSINDDFYIRVGDAIQVPAGRCVK